MDIHTKQNASITISELKVKIANFPRSQMHNEHKA